MRADASIGPNTHVLSVPTDGTPVNVAVQQWASDISNDCSSSVSAVIMPGRYVLNQEVKISNPSQPCSISRQIAIAAYTSYADTLYQTGVWARDSSGHYDNAVNAFHVTTPNVTISDNDIESNALPGNDSTVYGGAGVRFEGPGASNGSVLNNHFHGMQSSGVDTYGAANITVLGNTIACTPLTGGTRAGRSMGINVRGDGSPYSVANATVNGNTVSDCSDEAILVEGTSGARITNNDVECYVADCGYGISLKGDDNACVRNQPVNGVYVGYNTINGGNIRNPILAWGSAPTQRDTVEENNVNGGKTTSGPPMYQNSPNANGRGINFNASVPDYPQCAPAPTDPSLRSYAFIHNNRIQYTQGYGIYVGGDHTTLYGNYVDHANNGLVVEQGADYADVQSGRYTYNQMGLVMRARTFLHIYGNGMYNNAQWGACVYGTQQQPTIVEWNDYASNTGPLTRWTTGSGC